MQQTKTMLLLLNSSSVNLKYNVTTTATDRDSTHPLNTDVLVYRNHFVLKSLTYLLRLNQLYLHYEGNSELYC